MRLTCPTDLFANPAVCCVAIELIKTTRYYVHCHEVFQEPTDACSNLLDKRNNRFPTCIATGTPSGRGFLYLPLQVVQYM